MKSVHILLIDPIAFPGGSKIATSHILKMLNENITRVTIVTKDPLSWPASCLKKSTLMEPNFLASKKQGIWYFLRHILIVFSLIWARIKFGRIDIAVGASGPGVDLSLYIAKKLFGYDIVQLIHGPVACSRTIGRALLSANRVFYLQSCCQNLVQALKAIQPEFKTADLLNDPKFCLFRNGLPHDQWPTETSATIPKIFWAASLLKWKGLETLIETLKIIPANSRPESHICYIRPRANNLEMGPNPMLIGGVSWHENPRNLDQIRSECSIFVSTSKNEPFGLSILESMAAGLAIIIPNDGAYWDLVLRDKINCLKYEVEDPRDLALKILYLQQNPETMMKLSSQSKQIAQQYSSDSVYAEIVQSLTFPNRNPSNSNSNSNSRREFDHVKV
jgi:glycosyltransferase involved in cell wall biosynthesis